MSWNQYKPDRVSCPGETLKELIEMQGITQAMLANTMGRPLKTINEIIKGKAAIIPRTAIELEQILKVPAEFWVTREALYRLYLEREKK